LSCLFTRTGYAPLFRLNYCPHCLGELLTRLEMRVSEKLNDACLSFSPPGSLLQLFISTFVFFSSRGSSILRTVVHALTLPPTRAMTARALYWLWWRLVSALSSPNCSSANCNIQSASFYPLHYSPFSIFERPQHRPRCWRGWECRFVGLF